MMNQPPIDLMREKFDSRYAMVVAAAKRARQLLDGVAPLVACQSDKAVTIALWDLYEDRLLIERTGTGPK